MYIELYPLGAGRYVVNPVDNLPVAIRHPLEHPVKIEQAEQARSPNPVRYSFPWENQTPTWGNLTPIWGIQTPQLGITAHLSEMQLAHLAARNRPRYSSELEQPRVRLVASQFHPFVKLDVQSP